MKTVKVNKVALSLGLFGLISFGANAFDVVYWEWNASVDTTVTQTISANTDVTPTGLTMVENEQDMVGSVLATSSIIGAENISLDPLLGGQTSVESTATAVGNNASISSDVQMDIDSSQSFAGDDLLLIGNINATSSVLGTINASVDSAATAVANNMSMDLTTTSDQDAFMLANNVQSSSANINSLSTVDVALTTDYSGTDPFVSSSATSVGNNLDVKVDGIN
ncbi:hypothetical protein ACSK1W_003471 [Vibrio alginolyticus]